ncbi:MAG: diguanylate cyclase [Deltaproteobacteria bacterium]|nr:diguanylate cyclase [Deltaproteobacteria bacterium]
MKKNSWRRISTFKELIIIAAITVVIVILSSIYDVFEAVFEWIRTHEIMIFETNELIIASVVLVFLFGIFSFIRWRELNREVTERKHVEEALRKGEKQSSVAMEAARGIIFSYDVATGDVNLGGAIEEITGYTPEEFSLIDIDSWVERIHPNARDRVISTLQGAFQRNRATIEYRFRTKNGDYILLSSTTLTEKDEKGKPTRIVGILQDITERKRAEEAFLESEEKYRTLFQNALEAIYVVQDEKIKFYNPIAQELYGYSREELTSKPFTYFIHNEDQKIVSERYKKLLGGETFPTTYNSRIINKAGETKWVELNMTQFFWEDRPAILCFMTDITERKQTEEERIRLTEELKRLSVTDALTGIANRRQLINFLDQEIARSERTGSPFALLMIDLDHFKEVNDQYGHQVGDEVLKRLVAAFNKKLRKIDLLARYGGEEFCVVLPDTPSPKALEVADKLRTALRSLPAPMPTISIGIAYSREKLSWKDLVQQADQALYEAKFSGRDCVVVSQHANEVDANTSSAN